MIVQCSGQWEKLSFSLQKHTFINHNALQGKCEAEYKKPNGKKQLAALSTSAALANFPEKLTIIN